MKSRTASTATWLIAPVALLLAGCAAPQQEAEAQPEAPPFQSAVSINEVMVGVIDHNAHILWNTSLEEYAPKNDHDWHELEHAAITLASAGNMILIPCCGANDANWVADPDWQRYTQQQTDAALRILEAVENRDLNTIEVAGGEIVDACTGCHQQFKPDLPGIVAGPEEQPEHYYGYSASDRPE